MARNPLKERLSFHVNRMIAQGSPVITEQTGVSNTMETSEVWPMQGNRIFASSSPAIEYPMLGGYSIIVRREDYKARIYDRFSARRDPGRAGWFVFGRNPEYGDTLICVCAWRERSTSTRKLGWRTKREAQAIANAMDAGEM